MESQTKHRSITLEQITAAVFFLGVFFIPFSSFEGLSFLGEFKKEASIYFFLVAFGLTLGVAFFSKRIYIPYRNVLFQLLVVILVWFFLATLFNAGNIKDYYLKHTSGINRFVRQYGVLFISAFVLLITYYNILRRYSNKEIFVKIRMVFLLSLFVVTGYAVVEVMIIKLGIGQLTPVLELLNYFPFTEVRIDTLHRRISSVTYEPPALATYLLTISPWMFSYIITKKTMLRFIPGAIVLGLALISDSRAGLVIILVQACIFGLLLVKKRSYHQLLIKIVGIGMIFGLLFGVVKGKQIASYAVERVTSFKLKNDDHSISNKSRFGIQYALFQVFLERPISGVGFGQQAYEAVHKYPSWATSNNWEFKIKYLNPDHPSFPPGYNIYARILAEAGIVGFLLFALLVILILHSCYTIFRRDGPNSVFAMVLFISMIGFFMNWFKMDTFRVFGFWISFALLLSLTRNAKYSFLKKSENNGMNELKESS